MRIAVVINFERALTNRKFTSRRSTLIGEKTIFSYDLEEVEDPAGFARLKSFVGTIATKGLKAILVCQPQIDGNQRLYEARAPSRRFYCSLKTSQLSTRKASKKCWTPPGSYPPPRPPPFSQSTGER